MIVINSKYYNNSEVDIPDVDTPLFVTSAGHHILITFNKFETIRENGRRDFQLLYVKQGKIIYIDDGEEKIANAGSIIIYKPGEPQLYRYHLEDLPNIYWVHFTGYDVDNILKRLDLDYQKSFEVGISDSFEKIFNNIINELQEKKEYFSELINGYMQELLYLQSRNVYAQSNVENEFRREVKNAVHIINTTYKENFDVSKYAKNCNMSVSWFTKLFKRYTNMTPQQYLAQVRIEKAKALLSSTASIQEIAEVVGYRDPLYFSRVFKQKTGMAPSEYKKQAYCLPSVKENEFPWLINTKQ